MSDRELTEINVRATIERNYPNLGRAELAAATRVGVAVAEANPSRSTWADCARASSAGPQRAGVAAVMDKRENG
jgi:hypothetical protein